MIRIARARSIPLARARSLACWVGLTAGALWAPAVAAAQTERPLTRGLVDAVFTAPDASTRMVWLDRARTNGAGLVRLNVIWRSVALTRPALPTDPADPAYHWDAVDAAVVDASARGLRVLLSINRAPAWAERGPRRAGVEPGAWRPDPAALGAFAEAAARRYSGAYPDPRRPGLALPAVRSWQVWNEPNLAVYLAPQWRRERGRLVPAAATLYRALLNAFYRGVKAAGRDNLVVTAGTAPYGDSPGRARTRPARFWRDVLCLTASARRAGGCGQGVRFDALAHHPYAIDGPWRRALDRDDVALPDVWKLTRVVRAAVRSGSALPRRAKRVWVTEVSWDASPPDPHGVPADRHARWLAQALYVLWRQGVDTVLWHQIRDQAPEPSFAASNQSGLHHHTGAPRPAARAFAFPFVARRTARAGRVMVWTQAPTPGRLTIEGRVRGRWRTLKTLRAGTTPVQLPIAWDDSGALRARTAATTSLPMRSGP